MSRSSLKRLEVLAGVLAGVAFGAAFLLTFYFVWTAPRAPDPAIGRVVPLNNHGTFLYFTSAESLVHTCLFILAAVAAGSAVLIDMLADPFGRRR